MRFSIVDTGTRQALRLVWGDATGEVWAAGENGLLLRWKGGAFLTDQKQLTTESLAAISGDSPSSIWIVGDAGTILHWDGAEMIKEDSGTHVDLRSVYAADPDNVWAAGYDTTGSETVLLRRRAGRWVSESDAIGASALINALFGVDRNNVWGSSGGGFVHWDGSRWQYVSDLYLGTIFGLWGLDANHIWAVGWTSGGPTYGFIEFFDGSKWSQQSVPIATSFLRDVHGSGPNDIWAVGYSGTVLHYDGMYWTAPMTGITADLQGVRALGPSDVWVSGGHGELYHFDGMKWARQDSGVGSWLSKIWTREPDKPWVIGTGGVVLQRVP
jgi:hypothetical protein